MALTHAFTASDGTYSCFCALVHTLIDALLPLWHLYTHSLTHSFIRSLGVTRLSASPKSSLQMSFDSKYFKKEAASMADTTEFIVKG